MCFSPFLLSFYKSDKYLQPLGKYRIDFKEEGESGSKKWKSSLRGYYESKE